MDTRNLYRLHLVNGVYAIDPNYEVKFLYDETVGGDLVSVEFTQNESTIRPACAARGPLRVKYKKAK
jgi:hypothetical protein